MNILVCRFVVLCSSLNTDQSQTVSITEELDATNCFLSVFPHLTSYAEDATDL